MKKNKRSGNAAKRDKMKPKIKPKKKQPFKPFQFEHLPNELKILVMKDYMGLVELVRLSMTSNANEENVDEVISKAAKANKISKQFRCAGIDSFDHRSVESADFLRCRGIEVPIESIRPYTDAYYELIVSRHAEATKAFYDYSKAYEAALDERDSDEDDDGGDFWDTWYNSIGEKFPGLIYDWEDDFEVVHPDNIRCCCQTGDCEWGSCCSDDCYYEYHVCDHFETYVQYWDCGCFTTPQCVCFTLHGEDISFL